MQFKTVHLDERPAAVMRTTIEVEAIPAFLEHAFAATAEHIESQGADFAGPPFARYTPVDADKGVFIVEAGFPSTREVTGHGAVESSTLPGGEAVVTTHVGPYEAMQPVYEAIGEWIIHHGAVAVGPAWEVYYADPDLEPDPQTWRTDVVQPFRTEVAVR